ncbi:CopG family transcriptional regulator [Geoglobus acetivorans]|uniref:CopG family transcriptional regulator n=1 Tax=Geoglobus acetivorans TaxID=565033 RepID=A0A0A7GGC8_GEOAI|nr:CopG family transcriptional regulator [Geoglobus acetivorans]
MIAGIMVLLAVIAINVFNQNSAPESSESDWNRAITLYKTQYCGCCEQYIAYLRENGYNVEVVNVDDLPALFDKYRVPDDMRSCHISDLGGYFAVGHIPTEAIEKLMEEHPAVDGISLPGMPSGSPGMPGSKEEPFVVYALKDGNAEVFMTL